MPKSKPVPTTCPVCTSPLVLRHRTIKITRLKRNRRETETVAFQRKKHVCLNCNIDVVLHVHDRKAS